MTDFANILRTVRKEHHLTQEQAAEAFVISVGTLQRVEAGKRDLTYRELEDIAKYCKCSVEEIVRLGMESAQSDEASAHREPPVNLEKVIEQQNEHISSLLEEIRRLCGIVKNVVSGGGRNVNG